MRHRTKAAEQSTAFSVQQPRIHDNWPQRVRCFVSGQVDKFLTIPGCQGHPRRTIPDDVTVEKAARPLLEKAVERVALPGGFPGEPDCIVKHVKRETVDG